jgi:hypothetical protein
MGIETGKEEKTDGSSTASFYHSSFGARRSNRGQYESAAM